MAVHRNIRIRSPVADHHFGTGFALGHMEPFGIATPALGLFDIIFIHEMYCHNSSNRIQSRPPNPNSCFAFFAVNPFYPTAADFPRSRSLSATHFS